jgi:hypothetical protein
VLASPRARPTTKAGSSKSPHSKARTQQDAAVAKRGRRTGQVYFTSDRIFDRVSVLDTFSEQKCPINAS